MMLLCKFLLRRIRDIFGDVRLKVRRLPAHLFRNLLDERLVGLHLLAFNLFARLALGLIQSQLFVAGTLHLLTSAPGLCLFSGIFFVT